MKRNLFFLVTAIVPLRLLRLSIAQSPIRERAVIFDGKARHQLIDSPLLVRIWRCPWFGRSHLDTIFVSMFRQSITARSKGEVGYRIHGLAGAVMTDPKPMSERRRITTLRLSLKSKLLVFAIAAMGSTGPATSQVMEPIFDDVTGSAFARGFIEIFATEGVTSGCGARNFCPDDSVTRAQMAVFLERGMRGGDFVPAPPSGNVFQDVAVGDFAASFIEQLYADGITAGCGNNNFCPYEKVTRAQMAVFLLRGKYGPSYRPAPAVGVFDDVPAGYWAAGWIEALAREGITSGCSANMFCPEEFVTRAQMAVFLVRAFEIGGFVYVGGRSDRVDTISMSTLRFSQPVITPIPAARQMNFSPDGRELWLLRGIDTFSAIVPGSMTVIREFSAALRFPFKFLISPDGAIIYAINEPVFCEFDAETCQQEVVTLSSIDGNIIDRLEYTFSGPNLVTSQDHQISADGSKIYFIGDLNGANQLYVFDTASNTLETPITGLGGDRPNSFAISSDGSTGFVLSREIGSAGVWLSTINLASKTVLETIGVGFNIILPPALSPDESEIWGDGQATPGSGYIWIADVSVPGTTILKPSIAVESVIRHIAFSPDQSRVFVVVQSTGELARLLTIDFVSRDIINSVSPVSDNSNFVSYDIQFSQDGNKGFLLSTWEVFDGGTPYSQTYVTAFDVQSGAKLRSFSLGTEAFGDRGFIAVSPP